MSDARVWDSRTVIEEGRKVWDQVVARRAALTAAIVFLVAMIIYLQTILLGPAFFDTAEYQAAPYVLGICIRPATHSTGSSGKFLAP